MQQKEFVLRLYLKNCMISESGVIDGSKNRWKKEDLEGAVSDGLYFKWLPGSVLSRTPNPSFTGMYSLSL